MADNTNEDEYRPVEQNSAALYGSSTPNNITNRPLMLKRAVIIIAVIILGSLLIKCQSSSKPKVTVQKTELKTTAVSPPMTSAKPVAASSASAPVVSTPQITAPVDLNSQRLDKVEAKLTTLESGLAELSNKLTATNAALQQLTGYLIQQQTQLQQLQAKQKAQLAVIKKSKSNYYVQAAMPGRAWLVGNDGGSLTISIGSQIPGYGVVQDIDAEQGIVSTSSGRTIEYNPKDS